MVNVTLLQGRNLGTKPRDTDHGVPAHVDEVEVLKRKASHHTASFQVRTCRAF